MKHNFLWDGTSYSWRTGERPVQFLGSFVCSNCGMKFPCLNEQVKVYLDEMIPHWNNEDDDECDMIVISKVLES